MIYEALLWKVIKIIKYYNNPWENHFFDRSFPVYELRTETLRAMPQNLAMEKYMSPVAMESGDRGSLLQSVKCYDPTDDQ